MKQKDIDKAFENRFRIKSESHQVAWVKGVKALCRDFFEAGVDLGEAEQDEVFEQPACAIKEINVLSVDDTFNHWWTLYDKKRGREKCYQKWLKMTAKEHFDCIAATPAYVASTEEKQYRKDPLTYLNGKCWNDEIIIKNGTKQSTDKQQQQLSKLADILTD